MVHFLALLTVACIALQVYHYALYPLILGLLSVVPRRARGTAPAPEAQSVSLVICAYNEGGVIREKLLNSLSLDPAPAEIILVDDGSTDGTADIARQVAAAEPSVKVLRCPARGGKSAAMNFGAEQASEEVLVFSDATEMYEPDAIHWLLEEFRDPTVAVASGAHRLRPPQRSANGNLVGKSEGLYWRYEDFIRRKESEIGATVASVGSMLAIRRSDWHALPPGTVNDDAWITMSALARGRNVRFASRAVSWETANESSRNEHVRRRRIAAGRVRLLGRRDVWPLTRPGVLWAFLSHKVLRLLLPIPMICGFLANLAVVLTGPHHVGFDFLLAAQVAVLLLAIAGFLAERIGLKWRLAHLVYHIVQSNMMTLAAMRDVLVGQNFLKWDKPTR